MPFDATDIRALAREISMIESARDGASARTRMAAAHAAMRARAQPARVLGVTGPPGAGKSTLVDRLITVLRAEDQRVAVVAIDPSSPFSGGAVLGDRIRMQQHAGDDAVFIRSVGSRGARGGLSRATRNIALLCAAYQFDWIIIETVGVGQSEFDIMELADTTLVVLTPESGDTVQTLKAGLLEIADIFVVNKGDREGADQMATGIQAMLQLGQHASGAVQETHDADHRIVTSSPSEPAPAQAATGWRVPVVTAIATRGEGIDQLRAQLDRHAAALATDTHWRARRATVRRQEFLALCAEAIVAQLTLRAASDPALATIIEQVGEGTLSPYAAVDDVVRMISGRI